MVWQKPGVFVKVSAFFPPVVNLLLAEMDEIARIQRTKETVSRRFSGKSEDFLSNGMDVLTSIHGLRCAGNQHMNFETQKSWGSGEE